MFVNCSPLRMCTDGVDSITMPVFRIRPDVAQTRLYSHTLQNPTHGGQRLSNLIESVRLFTQERYQPTPSLLTLYNHVMRFGKD